MVELIRQCARLHEAGMDIILCSSGAIAAGRERIDVSGIPDTLSNRQMFASVGQSRLMRTWDNLFELYGLHVGQMLLTRADVEDRERYLNARDVLHALLDYRIIPVVNENDAVATTEIRVGDNDNLSALVATLADADLLIILTDQQGMFTTDPRVDAEAKLIEEIDHVDEALRQTARSNAGEQGVGGMATKLQAADTARRAGADVVIASGRHPEVILRIVAGERIGTRFQAKGSRVASRKRWIVSAPATGGVLRVDDGARAAVLRKGGSLLLAGVTSVSGTFLRGSTVLVKDAAGEDVARGISRYDSDALESIKGCRSDMIHERLGYSYGPVVIHRDDLAVVAPDS